MNVTLMIVCVCLGGFGNYGCGHESLRVRYCDPCVQAVLADPCCETVEPCQPVATKKVLAAYAADPAETLSAELMPLTDLAYTDDALPVGYAGQALGYGGYGLGGGYGGLGGGIGWGNGQGDPGRGFGFVGATGGGSGGGGGGGNGNNGNNDGSIVSVNIRTGDVNVLQNQTQSQGQSQFQQQQQNQHQNGGKCGCDHNNVPLPASAWVALVGCLAVVGARRKGLLK